MGMDWMHSLLQPALRVHSYLQHIIKKLCHSSRKCIPWLKAIEEQENIQIKNVVLTGVSISWKNIMLACQVILIFIFIV